MAAKVAISRFKHKFLVEYGSREIQDDEVLALPPSATIQLVVLEFWPPDEEIPIFGKQDALVKHAEQGHVQLMEVLLEAAETDEPLKMATFTPYGPYGFWSKLVQQIKPLTLVHPPCCLQLTGATLTLCGI